MEVLLGRRRRRRRRHSQVDILAKVLYFQEFTKISGQEKDMGAFRPVPSTEFRGGSCCDSHFAWRYHIFKILPGGIETHSKTPIKVFFPKNMFLKKSKDSENGFPRRGDPRVTKTLKKQ